VCCRVCCCVLQCVLQFVLQSVLQCVLLCAVGSVHKLPVMTDLKNQHAANFAMYYDSRADF